MEIDPGRGLILVWLVQGVAAGEVGGQLYAAVKKRVLEVFGA